MPSATFLAHYFGFIAVGCFAGGVALFVTLYGGGQGGELITNTVPSTTVNEPSRSVYFGQGCFWHTQYDTVLIEQTANGAFGARSDAEVTSLVGYAGGKYAGGDSVCYHGLPATDYGKLGHAEAVGVELSANATIQLAQFEELAAHYFSHGFQSTAKGMQRLDPGDAGAEYRNVIGIPGGAGGSLYAALQQANVHGMPLLAGQGGRDGDAQDNYVVYVYDSLAFPFFRAETYHQFHTNDVLRRPVPPSYTDALKSAQEAAGRMGDTGCLGSGGS
jgi:peptide methionine sulfoxide reductase MsrA